MKKYGSAAQFVLGAGIFIAASALARGELAAHSGNAVVCFTDPSRTQIASVQLFDFWEQPKIINSPFTLDLGPAQLSVEEKLERVFGKMTKFDPMRAHAYRVRSTEILKQLSEYLLTGATLTSPNDDNSPLLPEPPCYKERFAIQIKDPIKYQKKFMFRGDLYNHPNTSSDARAGIILHEVLYEEALKLGHTDSDRIRRFAYFISSTFMNYATVPDYQALAEETKMTIHDVMAVQIASTGQIIYLRTRGMTGCKADDAHCRGHLAYPAVIEDQFKKLELEEGSMIELKSGKISNVEWHNSNSKVRMVRGNEWIALTSYSGGAYFHPSGTVKQAYLTQESTWPMPAGNVHGGAGARAIFHESGALQSIYLGSDFPFTLHGKSVVAKSESILEFDQSGKISQFHLAAETVLEVAGSTRQFGFAGDRLVSLDPQENVIKGFLALPVEIISEGKKHHLTQWVEFSPKGVATYGVPSERVKAKFDGIYDDIYTHVDRVDLLCQAYRYYMGAFDYELNWKKKTSSVQVCEFYNDIHYDDRCYKAHSGSYNSTVKWLRCAVATQVKL